MKENAYLIGSVPNVRYFGNLMNLLLKRDWNYADSGVLDRTHLRFFTEISLKRALNQHGFLIEEFAGLNRLDFSSFSIASYVKRLAMFFVIVITFGAYSDIRFSQSGFRARNISI
jgi:hypothetical protein